MRRRDIAASTGSAARLEALAAGLGRMQHGATLRCTMRAAAEYRQDRSALSGSTLLLRAGPAARMQGRGAY